jgi:hypothetical protein
MRDIDDDAVRHAALDERHRRLQRAAERVINAAEPALGEDNPQHVVPSHVIRILRRELNGEPQPNGMWMSVS